MGTSVGCSSRCRKARRRVVRVEPPAARTPLKGFADEAPHAHKEIAPTSEVSKRANFVLRVLQPFTTLLRGSPIRHGLISRYVEDGRPD